MVVIIVGLVSATIVFVIRRKRRTVMMPSKLQVLVKEHQTTKLDDTPPTSPSSVIKGEDDCATPVPLPPAYIDPEAHSKKGRSYLDLESCSIEDEDFLDDCDQELGEDGIVRLTYPQRLYIKSNVRFSRVSARQRSRKANARYTRAMIRDTRDTAPSPNEAPPLPLEEERHRIILKQASAETSNRSSYSKSRSLGSSNRDQPRKDDTPGSSLDSIKVNPSFSPPPYGMSDE